MVTRREWVRSAHSVQLRGRRRQTSTVVTGFHGVNDRITDKHRLDVCCFRNSPIRVRGNDVQRCRALERHDLPKLVIDEYRHDLNIRRGGVGTQGLREAAGIRAAKREQNGRVIAAAIRQCQRRVSHIALAVVAGRADTCNHARDRRLADVLDQHRVMNNGAGGNRNRIVRNRVGTGGSAFIRRERNRTIRDQADEHLHIGNVEHGLSSCSTASECRRDRLDQRVGRGGTDGIRQVTRYLERVALASSRRQRDWCCGLRAGQQTKAVARDDLNACDGCCRDVLHGDRIVHDLAARD